MTPFELPLIYPFILSHQDYVDPYGSIDVVSFYKNDVVICEGEDLIETYE